MDYKRKRSMHKTISNRWHKITTCTYMYRDNIFASKAKGTQCIKYTYIRQSEYKLDL